MKQIVGRSIRMRVFYGFLLIAVLSIIGISVISYITLRNALEVQNSKQLQNTVESLVSSLDYAVSHTTVTEKNIESVLQNKILEISDINKKDIIIYDMQGRYLLSNKKKDLVAQLEVSQDILRNLLKTKGRYDFTEYNKEIKANVTSSYIILKNNMLEPIAIVYFPFYHNDEVYLDTFQSYIKVMILANILIIIFSVWLSWKISHSLTKNIRKISDEITKINLNEDLEPVRYYNDDEFTPLINSYNKTLRLIEEQKKLLSFKEKESAWREMAKQVAHEVKNPLTPMKLLIQNFERKFDKNDPKIEEKVNNLCLSVVEQIDIVANAANAFSEFTKLPERKDEVINVNKEVASIVEIFNENKDIFISFNNENILVNFDKAYFYRIMNNLILNAQQAKDDGRDFRLEINIELFNKNLVINIVDNGIGIPKNKLEKIFEPNFTTKTSGTGFGLTMIKRMVEEYKGEISIRSEEGQGTSVRVTLPTNI